jgi:hypothetical protein
VKLTVVLPFLSSVGACTFRKISHQRPLSVINDILSLINSTEDKAQAICFSHGRRQVEAFLTMKGRQVLFINKAKCLGVIFLQKNYMEITYIFITIYSVLKIERLSVGKI